MSELRADHYTSPWSNEEGAVAACINRCLEAADWSDFATMLDESEELRDAVTDGEYDRVLLHYAIPWDESSWAMFGMDYDFIWTGRPTARGIEYWYGDGNSGAEEPSEVNTGLLSLRDVYVLEPGDPFEYDGTTDAEAFWDHILEQSEQEGEENDESEEEDREVPEDKLGHIARVRVVQSVYPEASDYLKRLAAHWVKQHE
ncbi:MAG: hypothetical protein RIG82_05800 [Phycisphaeraceae bacterium]